MPASPPDGHGCPTGNVAKRYSTRDLYDVQTQLTRENESNGTKPYMLNQFLQTLLCLFMFLYLPVLTQTLRNYGFKV